MPKQIDEDLLIKAAEDVFAERGYAGAVSYTHLTLPTSLIV